jgi:hypothetical protein
MLLAPGSCNDRHEAMSYSLVEAATACGINRSTVLRDPSGQDFSQQGRTGRVAHRASRAAPRLSPGAGERGTPRAGAAGRTDR